MFSCKTDNVIGFYGAARNCRSVFLPVHDLIEKPRRGTVFPRAGLVEMSIIPPWGGDIAN
jgi:hypothetical protein